MNPETVLIAPMRAQPFHHGHEYYIHQLSEYGDDVVILLNRKVDNENPFSFFIRKKWIEAFVNNQKILNVVVAVRLKLPKEIEYPLQAKGSSFTVLTTSETDEMYQNLGFCTLNHHKVLLPRPKLDKLLPGSRLPISDTGRIIRARLRSRKSCTDLMQKSIEEEACNLINSI